MIVYDKEQKQIVIPNGIGNINLFNNGVEAGYNQGKIDGIDEQKSKLESINITENGTYTKEDGYNHIEVNVPDLNVLTYSELKSLRDTGKLVAGTQYRITDYTCTTAQANTKSAGHIFDIIVTADDESTLNEEARAALHTGDNYFSGCNLSAWKIWYSFDNDTKRFAWADSANGKGVIYRMIDEWNNDVPYDFKNIQFRYDYWGSKYMYYYYTFASGNIGDNADNSLNISNGCYNNNIAEYILNGKRTLNTITFIGRNCYNNSFNSNCSNNIFGNSCSSNKFGTWVNNNEFGNNCDDNVFGSGCHNNSFGTNCISNIFANNCYSNTFNNDCYGNTFGNYCSLIFLGNNIYSNSFGNYCYAIKFALDGSVSKKYSHYNRNHFGDGCQYIFFTGAETASSTQQVQNYKFAQGLQGTSSAYLTIDGKRSRAYETKVAKNSNGELKIYCEADLIL